MCSSEDPIFADNCSATKVMGILGAEIVGSHESHTNLSRELAVSSGNTASYF